MATITVSTTRYRMMTWPEWLLESRKSERGQLPMDAAHNMWLGWESSPDGMIDFMGPYQTKRISIPDVPVRKRRTTRACSGSIITMSTINTANTSTVPSTNTSHNSSNSQSGAGTAIDHLSEEDSQAVDGDGVSTPPTAGASAAGAARTFD